MSSHSFTLSELNEQIKQSLHGSFPEPVWVIAEINDLSINRSGHCYLELIEKGKQEQIKAKCRATIWSYAFRMLKPHFETTTGQSLEAGLTVLIHVMVEFHEVYGLSLNIRNIDPSYTLGEMARQKMLTIRKLEEEGVMDMNKNLPLPEVIQKIAVISSETAAGYGDFRNQLTSNAFSYRFMVRLFPAIMQGKEAEESIVNALDAVFNQENAFDLVVIIRGGGAKSELSCFNNYWLTYHVTQFPLPVLSGIGHERDESVLDMVANTSVKTPTAAAEFIINHNYRFETRLKEFRDILFHSIQRFLQYENDKLLQHKNNCQSLLHFSMKKEEEKLRMMKEKLINEVHHFLSNHHEKHSHYKKMLPPLTRNHLVRQYNRLNQIIPALKGHVNHGIRQQQSKLEHLEKSIQYVDPQHVIKRGYSLTSKDGKIITDANQLSVNDVIQTRLRNGTLTSTIDKKEP